MSITHTQTVTTSLGAGGIPVVGNITETGGAEILIDHSFNAETADTVMAIAFTVASMKSVFLLADHDLTIETNSTESPGNTIALKAGVPLPWGSTAAYFANKFTVDVTAFYITCALATRLQGVILTT